MLLEHADYNRLIAYYTESLKMHGPHSPKSLRWITAKDQRARFRVLAHIGDLSGQTILDAGCGVGDFYGFLSGQTKNFTYLGVDAVPEMVEQARIKFPGVPFAAADMFAVQDRYDYVFASGSLTFNVRGGKQFYYSLIKHLYGLAKNGLAFNMLDDSLFTTDETYLSYNPEEVAALSKSITPNYKIITGYLSGDFTVYLYKP